MRPNFHFISFIRFGCDPSLGLFDTRNFSGLVEVWWYQSGVLILSYCKNLDFLIPIPIHVRLSSGKCLAKSIKIWCLGGPLAGNWLDGT